VKRDFGFYRVATASPEVRVADIDFNIDNICSLINAATDKDVDVLVFPELSITGYTCGDLFYQESLVTAAKNSLLKIAEFSKSKKLLIVIGLPLLRTGRLFNCAAILSSGEVIGFVPKTLLPNSAEYYENRWFTSSETFLSPSHSIDFFGNQVPFSKDLLFSTNQDQLIIGVELCEDLWGVKQPSSEHALAGANLILNLSASNETLGKSSYRRDLVNQQSARCIAAYAYSSVGPGESTTDVVFSGHCLISENGLLLKESDRFIFKNNIIYSDIDVNRINHDRQRSSSFKIYSAIPHRIINFSLETNSKLSKEKLGSVRPYSKTPFVPKEKKNQDEICNEILMIQMTGLIKRLNHTNTSKVVIGLSGGLDSTLALMVIFSSFEKLNLVKKGIHVLCMPGFGTTTKTFENAINLATALDTTIEVIDIKNAVEGHFIDIKHSKSKVDITYENSQARERTQILMDYANKISGLVIGTGDLSELALGWCTYNGDHMSMYNVNAGVPKTLVKHIVEWYASTIASKEISQVLLDIVSTPISPELLPINSEGICEQNTEEIIGPYVLHDFYLYYLIRHGFSPSKILYLAELIFKDQYDRVTLLKWLEVFIKRFFSQQFKRSAMPDGPKIGSVALSPRGDWKMPSDAVASLWLESIKNN
jgi:NAD+ synthase (glutamine-hydrolysing)